MVERVQHRLGLTSLSYQHLSDLVHAIGLPKEKVCTYCWDGAEPYASCSRSPETGDEETSPTQPD